MGSNGEGLKKHLTYAVYRIYYGRDLILRSIESVINDVDHVFVFFVGPWNDIVDYEEDGERHPFPVDPDGSKKQVVAKYDGHPKVSIQNSGWNDQRGQFSHFINDVVLQSAPKPDAILINEFDHVWKDLRGALDYWRSQRNLFVSRCSKVEQVELWKPPTTDQYWKIPERPERTGPLLWDMREGPIEQTIWHGYSPMGMNVISGVGGVHNFGYCVDEETMRWKVRCAYESAKHSGDSLPRRDYVESCWGVWRPGDRDLEISERWKSKIPEVEPYPQELVP